MTKRKRCTAAFKAQVALEAIKGQQTINEIAPAHGAHPNQVAQWKKQALEGAPSLFASRGREQDAIERPNQAWGADITYIRLEFRGKTTKLRTSDGNGQARPQADSERSGT